MPKSEIHILVTFLHEALVTAVHGMFVMEEVKETCRRACEKTAGMRERMKEQAEDEKEDANDRNCSNMPMSLFCSSISLLALWEHLLMQQQLPLFS